MRRTNRLASSAAVAAALLALAGAGQLSGTALAQNQGNIVMRESVAAVVDDEIITTYDVRQRMLWLVITTGITPTRETETALQREALRALIDESLQMQFLRRFAREQRIDPSMVLASDEDVDDALARIAAQNGAGVEQFLAEFNALGLSTRAVREQLRANLSWQRYTRGRFGNRVRVSPDQVNAVMENIQASASKPAYLISEIFLSAERSGGMENAVATANQIIAQLQAQGRFEPLALQFSSLPTAARGGDAGWMTAGELHPEVESVLEQLRPGQVTRPIEVSGGVYIVYLRDKQTAQGDTIVRLRQVALPLAPDAQGAPVEAAQQRLLSIRDDINGCANIDQVAQDAGMQAADLGEANIEDLAPGFREAVVDLDEGQVSDPVRTSIGLHIVAVCSRTTTGGVAIPTREEIEAQLLDEQLAMIQRRELRNLRNAAVISQPR